MNKAQQMRKKRMQIVYRLKRMGMLTQQQQYINQEMTKNSRILTKLIKV